MRFPGLNACGSATQLARLPDTLSSVPAARVRRLATCVRSGPPHADCRAPHGVASGTALCQEDGPPAPAELLERLGGWPSLPGQPLREVHGRVHHHPERHARVLDAAVLRALTSIDTGTVRLEPGLGRTTGNQIHLPLERGDPEAVDDIAGREPHPHAPAGGNVQLVGGRHGLIRGGAGIVDLPPPLVPGHLDREVVGRSHGGERSQAPQTSWRRAGGRRWRALRRRERGPRRRNAGRRRGSAPRPVLRDRRTAPPRSANTAA